MTTRISKINILLFWFYDDWGTFGRAYERVAEHLAKLPEINHVTCMFPPVSARQFSLQSALRIKPISQKLTLITQTDHNILRLDASFTRIRQYINEKYQLYVLHAHLRHLGFRKKNTILWLFPPHPYIERLLEIVPHRGVVTHVIDDFSKFDPSHKLYSYAQAQYPKLGKWSDMIITTSQANLEMFQKTRRPCHLFYPAVDESFLGTPSLLPHRAQGAPPHIGYVGFIMERTDLDLVKYIAVNRPQWKLTLVGPQYPEGILERTGLLSLQNVEYLGPMPQKDVPDFLQSLDVCLMPHRDTEYSRSMGPLKLYQYLASGRPIVSTSVAGLDRVREHIRVANNYNEFVLHIEDAFQTDTSEMATKRIAAARRETWNVRIREIFDVVYSTLVQRSPATAEDHLPEDR